MYVLIEVPRFKFLYLVFLTSHQIHDILAVLTSTMNWKNNIVIFFKFLVSGFLPEGHPCMGRLMM